MDGETIGFLHYPITSVTVENPDWYTIVIITHYIIFQSHLLQTLT